MKLSEGKYVETIVTAYVGEGRERERRVWKFCVAEKSREWVFMFERGEVSD